MPRSRRTSVAALLLLLPLLACGPRKQSWKSLDVPEVVVDVLPSDAELMVDGVSLGQGGRSIPVQEPTRAYLFRVKAAGFLDAERSVMGGRLVGARLGIALRPEGFGEARRLDFDDGPSLALASSLLVRGQRYRHAMEYASRAVQLSPDAVLAHRAIGDAAHALGDRQRAIQAYSTYLRLAPNAPDKAVVERRVEKLRGDMTIPPIVR